MTPKQEAQGGDEDHGRGEAVADRNEAAPQREVQPETAPEHEDQEDEASEPQTLDLTEGPIARGLSPHSFVSSPYNIDRDREQKRGLIALILVGLLAAVVLLSFAGLLTSRIELKDLKELLTVILSPLVALVGAATGFYFGEKSKGKL
jgi:hypothetical protein